MLKNVLTISSQTEDAHCFFWNKFELEISEKKKEKLSKFKIKLVGS